jgi:hypothetical protein
MFLYSLCAAVPGGAGASLDYQSLNVATNFIVIRLQIVPPGLEVAFQLVPTGISLKMRKQRSLLPIQRSSPFARAAIFRAPMILLSI